MKTGLVYSDRYLEHDTGLNHPERAARIQHIDQFIRSSDLNRELCFLEPRVAKIHDLTLIHPISYVHRVREACESGEAFFDSLDTAVCPKSFEVALLAAGGVLTLVDAVMSGAVENGFAVVRPPGHHAERERALGFCLFNNVAIAARYIQKKYRFERILIIDWDVHHGNGTQHIFENDPSVFYFSTHQYPFYPGTGAEHEIGTGIGMGATLNAPLPAGSGDREYKRVFQDIFYPKAIEFKPDFILISCGFDAHRLDPLAQMDLTEEAYGFFTDIAKQVAKEAGHGRIVSALEGGYHLEMISRSAYVHLKQLMA